MNIGIFKKQLFSDHPLGYIWYIFVRIMFNIVSFHSESSGWRPACENCILFVDHKPKPNLKFIIFRKLVTIRWQIYAPFQSGHIVLFDKINKNICYNIWVAFTFTTFTKLNLEREKTIHIYLFIYSSDKLTKYTMNIYPFHTEH